MHLLNIRSLVGGVLYEHVFPCLAWWHQHDITSIAKWLLATWSLITKWSMAIWQSCNANTHWHSSVLILLNICWQFGILLSLNTCWQFGVLVLLNVCWQFGVTLLLNSIDSVNSFCWTSRSKLCFLTCFSYFSRHFLTLVFLQNWYLINFFAPFSAAQESNFLSHFLVPLALQGSTSYMRPYVSGTEHKGFLKQDSRRVTTGNLTAFCLFLKVSHANVHWENANHTFLTHKNPQAPFTCVS